MGEPEGGVMTTGEAAARLGIRVHTIKHWVADRLLEGCLRGERVIVSRRSVETMLARPEFAQRRERQARLDEAFAPLIWPEVMGMDEDIEMAPSGASACVEMMRLLAPVVRHAWQDGCRDCAGWHPQRLLLQSDCSDGHRTHAWV